MSFRKALIATQQNSIESILNQSETNHDEMELDKSENKKVAIKEPLYTPTSSTTSRYYLHLLFKYLFPN